MTKITTKDLPRLTRIKELRERSKISQVELAAASGVSLTTLRKLENAVLFDELALTGVGHFIHLGESLGVTAATIYPALHMRILIR